MHDVVVLGAILLLCTAVPYRNIIQLHAGYRL